MTIDKKKVIANTPYVIFFLIGDKLGYALRVYEGNQLLALMKGIAELFHAPFFSSNPLDMLIGAGAAVDGPAGSGKGTVTKSIEKELNTARHAGVRQRTLSRIWTRIFLIIFYSPTPNG